MNEKERTIILTTIENIKNDIIISYGDTFQKVIREV